MQWTIFPWAMNCSNHLKDADQVRPIQIPDVEPSSLIGENQGLLGMAAGDFVEVFSRDEFKANFDALVTCFFLDTAHNAIEYMEIIRRVLKVGVVCS
jgi:carnosine N-methyltransferase